MEKITVESFLALADNYKHIYIKPNGKGFYYDGLAFQVPTLLKSCFILEIDVRTLEDFYDEKTIFIYIDFLSEREKKLVEKEIKEKELGYNSVSFLN